MTDKSAQSLDMQRTVERLACSDFERWRAVSAFPISVAQMAFDMQKILDAAEFSGVTKEVAIVLLGYERGIRDAYRKQFGTELGQ